MTSGGYDLLDVLRNVQSLHLIAEEPELLLDPLPHRLTPEQFRDPLLNVEVLLVANAFAVVAAGSCVTIFRMIILQFNSVKFNISLTRILQCDHAGGFARPLADGAAEASLGVRHQSSGQEEKRCQHPHGDLGGDLQMRDNFTFGK